MKKSAKEEKALDLVGQLKNKTLNFGLMLTLIRVKSLMAMTSLMDMAH
jgi:hypothetical protein